MAQPRPTRRDICRATSGMGYRRQTAALANQVDRRLPDNNEHPPHSPSSEWRPLPRGARRETRAPEGNDPGFRRLAVRRKSVSQAGLGLCHGRIRPGARPRDHPRGRIGRPPRGAAGGAVGQEAAGPVGPSSDVGWRAVSRRSRRGSRPGGPWSTPPAPDQPCRNSRSACHDAPVSSAALASPSPDGDARVRGRGEQRISTWKESLEEGEEGSGAPGPRPPERTRSIRDRPRHYSTHCRIPTAHWNSVDNRNYLAHYWGDSVRARSRRARYRRS
jgi:hypothetical protein